MPVVAKILLDIYVQPLALKLKFCTTNSFVLSCVNFILVAYRGKSLKIVLVSRYIWTYLYKHLSFFMSQFGFYRSPAHQDP